MKKLAVIMFGLFFAAPAAAADAVSLSSEVLVERTVQLPGGKTEVKREAPKVVVPGDKLVFVLAYKNEGRAPATDLDITNPIPELVSFHSAEGGAVVSVDAGKSWGLLPSPRIKAPDGTERAAIPADVTHIRWTFGKPIPAGAGGNLTFRGVVK